MDLVTSSIAVQEASLVYQTPMETAVSQDTMAGTVIWVRTEQGLNQWRMLSVCGQFFSMLTNRFPRLSGSTSKHVFSDHQRNKHSHVSLGMENYNYVLLFCTLESYYS